MNLPRPANITIAKGASTVGVPSLQDQQGAGSSGTLPRRNASSELSIPQDVITTSRTVSLIGVSPSVPSSEDQRTAESNIPQDEPLTRDEINDLVYRHSSGSHFRRTSSPSASPRSRRPQKYRSREVTPTRSSLPSRRLLPLDAKIIYDCNLGDRMDWRREHLTTERPSKRRKVVSSRNFLVSEIILDALRDDVIMNCTQKDIEGNVCVGKVVFRKKGTHQRYRAVLKCNTCDYEKSDVPTPHPGYPAYKTCDLRETYHALSNDVGHRGLRDIIASHHVVPQAVDTFQDNATCVFEEMETWFNFLDTDRHNMVRHFYYRQGKHEVNGKLNICVSIDGTYTKRSFMSIYNSIYELSFVFDTLSGTCLAYVALEKCLDPACFTSTTVKCKHGKFHGASSSLEVSAAKMLFDQSLEPGFPFRYSIMVGDGDADVLRNVQDTYMPKDDAGNVYYDPKYRVKKQECTYHYRKRVRSCLTGAFDKAPVLHLVTCKKTGQKIKKPNYPYRANKSDLANRFANLVLYTIRKFANETPDNEKDDNPTLYQQMSDAVMAIFFHHLDHRNANINDRRTRFHKLCNISYCKFLQCEARCKDRKNFEESYSYVPTDSKGNPRDGDLYIAIPQQGLGHEPAMEYIITAMRPHADPELMSRLTMFRNTNINEAIHARFYRILDKTRFYQLPHIQFAAHQTINIHNHGYEDGSLLNKEDWWMTENELKTLIYKDNKLRKHAKKNQKIKETETPTLADGEIHYASGRNFEQNPPLSRLQEFEERDNVVWRKDPSKQATANTVEPEAIDVQSVDERDPRQAHQDEGEAAVQAVIEDIIDQVYYQTDEFYDDCMR